MLHIFFIFITHILLQHRKKSAIFHEYVAAVFLLLGVQYLFQCVKHISVILVRHPVDLCICYSCVQGWKKCL